MPDNDTPMIMPESELVEQKPPTDKDSQTVSWTASEFIAHQKTAGWYGILAVVSLILAVSIYLLTKDFITTGFVIFGAAILGYYASRQPRELNYQINENSVVIGAKSYGYDEFRSFSIMTEGAFSSIIFMPLKRFAPLRAIYFAPEHEDQIIGILMPRLPFEEHSHDLIDKLMLRIRF